MLKINKYQNFKLSDSSILPGVLIHLNHDKETILRGYLITLFFTVCIQLALSWEITDKNRNLYETLLFLLPPVARIIFV